MNLNKSICKRCWNKHFEKKGFSTRWNEWDEQRWNKGFICCTHSLEDRLVYITEIPKCCPYILEHLTQ